jgi:hypothetical protein
MEKKIYNKWAFTKNEMEKAKINQQIYKEIKDKAKVECIKFGYHHNIYKIVDNPEGLSNTELALICDHGNLCFGYTMDGGNIRIFTD